ncbi:MAG: hypothetical protein MZV70_40095 [Desulfobacterales bacterium]|nr:hypothetical protein [Desulfobacterales bacterium]
MVGMERYLEKYIQKDLKRKIVTAYRPEADRQNDSGEDARRRALIISITTMPSTA